MKELFAFLFLIVTTFSLLFTTSKPALADQYSDCLATGNTPTECRAVSGAWYVQSPDAWQQKVFQSDQTEVFKERYTLSILTDVANSVVAATGGVKKLAYDQNGQPYYTYEGGAISILANLTGVLYTAPPASSIEYLADLGQNIGIVKPAMAQGIGFSGFSPVLTLWKIFRDLAYLGFVVIFVIVGFMIMFRKKIDPRTVVTIQDALPRIVITLILVTFSYAIAGLVVDLADLSTKITVNLFAGKFIALENTGATGVSTAEKVNRLLAADIFHLVNPLRDIGNLVSKFPDIALSYEGQALAGLAGLTIGVVFVILGFFVMFKIFFSLIGPYVSIVLSVVFAPIMILMEALPGSQNSFLNWLRGLIANVAVFPVVFIMLVMAAIFKSGDILCQPYGGWSGMKDYIILGPADWATKCESIGTTLWMAPGIGNWGSVVGQLVSFGILFAIPRVADMIKQSLEVKPGIAQQVIGEELKGGLGRVPLIGSFLPK